MSIKSRGKKLINSFRYAIEGFISSFKTERNMKIHVLATILVIIIGIKLDRSVETGFFKVFNIELKGRIILWNTSEFLGGRRNI